MSRNVDEAIPTGGRSSREPRAIRASFAPWSISREGQALEVLAAPLAFFDRRTLLLALLSAALNALLGGGRVVSSILRRTFAFGSSRRAGFGVKLGNRGQIGAERGLSFAR